VCGAALSNHGAVCLACVRCGSCVAHSMQCSSLWCVAHSMQRTHLNCVKYAVHASAMTRCYACRHPLPARYATVLIHMRGLILHTYHTCMLCGASVKNRPDKKRPDTCLASSLQTRECYAARIACTCTRVTVFTQRNGPQMALLCGEIRLFGGKKDLPVERSTSLKKG